MAGADWLRAAEAEPVRERVVEVMACNWDAVQVYLHCAQTVVGAGFGVLHLGVSAAECRAAIALLRPPRTRWPEILDGVQHIGQMAAAALNRRAQRR